MYSKIILILIIESQQKLDYLNNNKALTITIMRYL